MNLAAYLNPQGSSRFQVQRGIMPEVFAEGPSGYEELGFGNVRNLFLKGTLEH